MAVPVSSSRSTESNTYGRESHAEQNVAYGGNGKMDCGFADVDIEKLELNFILGLGVNVRVRVGVRVSISIYLICHY